MGICLDPCTNDQNPVGARRFYTPEDDGIVQSWRTGGWLFMNPPYGRDIHLWIDRFVETEMARRGGVMLVPARTDTKWFHRAMDRSQHARTLSRWHVVVIKGRLKFHDPVNGCADHHAPFPSVLVFDSGVSPKAVRAFADLGITMVVV